ITLFLPATVARDKRFRDPWYAHARQATNGMGCPPPETNICVAHVGIQKACDCPIRLLGQVRSIEAFTLLDQDSGNQPCRETFCNCGRLFRGAPRTYEAGEPVDSSR